MRRRPGPNDAQPGQVVARLYLPMEMGAFARILKAISAEFPRAVLSEQSAEGEVVVSLPAEP